MGMSVGATGSKGGRRRRRGAPRYSAMADINMTPFIDVMLVLLIIFMVAAPLLTVGVPIDLPETAAKQLDADKEPITISIDTDGRIFLMETEIAIEELVPKLEAIAKAGEEERIFVRGDREIAYGTIMKVMGTISAAGYKRVGIVTTLDNSN